MPDEGARNWEEMLLDQECIDDALTYIRGHAEIEIRDSMRNHLIALTALKAEAEAARHDYKRRLEECEVRWGRHICQYPECGRLVLNEGHAPDCPFSILP